MSSILKALKKAEDEKRAKLGQRVDITRDIFGAAQPPSTPPRWPLLAGGIAGTLALGVVAFLLLPRPGTGPTPPPSTAETRPTAALPSPPLPVESRAAVSPPPQEPSPVVQPKPAPAPVAESKIITTKPGDSLTTHTKVVAVRSGVLSPLRPRADAAKTKLLPTATGGPVTTLVKQQEPTYAPPPVISANRPVISAPPLPPQRVKPGGAVAPPPYSATGTPKIMVSGIAYNKDAPDRLAVINGAPAGEGKTVNGVTVEEIMPDKVRFSYGQKSFEVPVGRSNQ